MKVAQSCLTLRLHGLYSWSMNSPGQNTGEGSLSLIQGIFLMQESNWGLLHCQQILYQLSYQGSPQCRRTRFYLGYCLETSMDKGAWGAAAHVVANGRT